MSLRPLVFEYKQSLRELNKLKDKYKKKGERTKRDEADISIINSMIADVEYAIQWLQSGRNPDLRRGIDKTGVYLTDPRIIENLKVETNLPESKELSPEEKELIEDALCTLTRREKDAFMLVKVEGITFEYAAELLGIKKSSIQTYLDRAEKKIEKRKNESLFLVS